MIDLISTERQRETTNTSFVEETSSASSISTSSSRDPSSIGQSGPSRNRRESASVCVVIVTVTVVACPWEKTRSAESERSDRAAERVELENEDAAAPEERGSGAASGR